MNYNKLTSQEKSVILNKGTEPPFTGIYEKHNEKGTYICKQCNAPLYRSDAKFDSGCGWPSFDDEIPEAVVRQPDADGRRTEIICAKCGGHLGHVFIGEGFTDKNTRHCVNSISLNFQPWQPAPTNNIAYFAGGCFWGVEHFLENSYGVTEAISGYMGGHIKNPCYKEVCTGSTGHAEVVKVIFDPAKTNYEKLAKLFFEIHDFTQLNRQGPDIGEQYRSEIFYVDDNQKEIATKIINILKEKNFAPVTKLTKATEFYQAEEYHQDYYKQKGGMPYCHGYRKIFDD